MVLFFDWNLDIFWVHAPFYLIGKIWRKLREQKAIATLIVPFWTSATLEHLIAPDAKHFSELVIDCMWLPMNDSSLFVSGKTASGCIISPPNWQTTALRVDFSSSQPNRVLSKRDRCIQEGCYACGRNNWRRKP